MSSADLTKISEEVLARAFTKARERLDIWGFYSSVKGKNTERGETLEEVVGSSEELYGLYGAVMNTLIPTNILGEVKGKLEAKKILNYFSLYTGCNGALEVFGEGGEEERALAFGLEDFDFGLGRVSDYEASMDKMIKHQVSLLKESRNLKRTQRDFLVSVKKGIEEEIRKNNSSYRGYLEILGRVNLAVKGKVFRGFSYEKREGKAREEILTFKEEKIVGNEEVERELYGLVNLIGLYDPESRTNIELGGEKPLNVLLYGGAGTGKTMLMRNISYRMSRLAQIKGIGFRAVMFDNSYKDPYHGVDVKNLRAKFEELKEPSRINLGIVDDAEGVFQSRFAWDASHIEAQSTNEILGQLDGLKTNYLGNFMLLLATNAMGKVDPALVSRMTVQLEVRGPREEGHYIEILRNELGRKISYVNLDEGEWRKVGRLCREYGLNGRDVNKVTTLLKGHITNAENIGRGVQTLGFKEQGEALRRVYQKVGYSEIEKLVKERYEAKIVEERERWEEGVRNEYLALKMKGEARLRLKMGRLEEELKGERLDDKEIEKRLGDYQKQFWESYGEKL